MMRPIHQLGEKGKMLKSIVCTYPDFRTLPKGVKQMLVISENIFFEEMHTTPVEAAHEPAIARVTWWQPPQVQFSMNGYAAFSA
jgi:hypothetical protein